MSKSGIIQQAKRSAEAKMQRAHRALSQGDWITGLALINEAKADIDTVCEWNRMAEELEARQQVAGEE